MVGSGGNAFKPKKLFAVKPVPLKVFRKLFPELAHPERAALHTVSKPAVVEAIESGLAVLVLPMPNSLKTLLGLFAGDVFERFVKVNVSVVLVPLVPATMATLKQEKKAVPPHACGNWACA